MHLSTANFEHKHLELAADVAAVVRTAGRSLGTFYGRDLHSFDTTCEQVEIRLRRRIPITRRALGRPDADPTQR
jgi:hypothetical protein